MQDMLTTLASLACRSPKISHTSAQQQNVVQLLLLLRRADCLRGLGEQGVEVHIGENWLIGQGRHIFACFDIGAF